MKLEPPVFKIIPVKNLNKSLIVLIFVAGSLMQASAAKFITKQGGDWTNKNTWLNLKVPNLLLPDSIYIYHDVEMNPGNEDSYAYIYIDTMGKLLQTSNQFHNYGTLDVYGYIYVPNTFHNHTDAVVNIHSTGWMWAGVNWWNDGLVLMTGGYICWKEHGFNLPSNPIQGWGTICDAAAYPYHFSGGPLPIQLLDLGVTCTGGPVKITWKTVNEENNDFFTIEKSTDLKKWDVVTHVKGSGTSHGILEYSAFDYAKNQGIAYYRLVQTDFDGMVTIFEDKWIRVSECSSEVSEDLAVYPNPVKRGTQVNLCSGSATFEGKVKVTAFSSGGNKVVEYLAENQNVNQKILIETGQLNRGTYLIRVENNLNSWQKVLVVN